MSLSLTLTRRLQLWNMGLTELPSEVLRLKSMKTLWLNNNDLCSLPTEIARLNMLDKLIVRPSK
jgi:Leucine-rich repeat (LRR) protein